LSGRKVINRNSNPKTLVLGLGNIIMGDEGIGVHVIRALVQHSLPPNIECLDGGTGGFILLEPLQNAEDLPLAAAGRPPQAVRCVGPVPFHRDEVIDRLDRTKMVLGCRLLSAVFCAVFRIGMFRTMAFVSFGTVLGCVGVSGFVMAR